MTHRGDPTPAVGTTGLRDTFCSLALNGTQILLTTSKRALSVFSTGQNEKEHYW